MKLHRLLLASALIGAATLASISAHAASDGTLGLTSTGTSDVTLDVNEVFRISDLADIALGAYTVGGSDLTGYDDVCVYSNGDGSYQVTITDSTSTVSTGSFTVEDTTNTYEIPFTVAWNNATGIVGATPVAYNTPLVTNGANTTAQDCSSGGLSANLSVNVLATDLDAARAGNYASTLTILVEAD